MTNAILVVDEAATARMYHRSILEQGNFSVAEAANGYEALEVTLQRRFDLMLVDVNMPRMDGYTFVESVRRAGLVRGVRSPCRSQLGGADRDDQHRGRRCRHGSWLRRRYITRPSPKLSSGRAKHAKARPREPLGGYPEFCAQ